MKLSISKEATTGLLELPESGLGFQIVNATFHGTRSTYIIWNADYAVDLREAPSLKEDLSGANLGFWINEQALSEITIIAAPSLHDFSLVGARIGPSVIRVEGGSSAPAASPPPSTLVKKINLGAPRKFYRFSPFNNDRRIDPLTGDFLPGTYCCPESEILFVPTGLSAVGRFALPSPRPASFKYEITANAGTEVLFGTVAPAYGQAGGGVEAYFPMGARNATGVFKTPAQIADE